MANLSASASPVRAEFDDFVPFEPDPRDAAWVLGHSLGLDGVDARPDPDCTTDEADAFRRGYSAGLDAGGWSLDLMFLDDPSARWHESERVEAAGVMAHRMEG